MSLPKAPARWQFVLGCLLAVAPLAGLAELYLRLFPPKDLHPFLGEASPLTGLYQPDQDFGVAYRSWHDFHRDNAERLDPYLPFAPSEQGKKLWAFFGNSFVQAPGMLADTARASLPEHSIFNLGRNEPLVVRLAQIKLLLANGMAPERIFVELMPVDTVPLGEQPLASLCVTSRGALTYRPQLPEGGAGLLTTHSRLAFTAWTRSGRQRGNPRFNSKTLYQGVEDPLLGDLRRLFAQLAQVAERQHVPVTVLLIPSYHQVLKGDSWEFQNQLGALFLREGLDVFDPREAFSRHADPATLYLPDKHLTPEGNQLLLAELLRHLCEQDSRMHPGLEAN